jgi:hypothetical protein
MLHSNGIGPVSSTEFLQHGLPTCRLVFYPDHSCLRNLVNIAPPFMSQTLSLAASYASVAAATASLQRTTIR